MHVSFGIGLPVVQGYGYETVREMMAAALEEPEARPVRDRALITQERLDLLRLWRHSGFSVHNHTTVYPSDTEDIHPGATEALAKAASSRGI